MRKFDFSYQLPAELIAQQPLHERTASRLLVLDGTPHEPRDTSFADLPSFLRPGDLLVFNDTRVLPARILCRKTTGGRVELLLERIVSDCEAMFQVRSNKPLRDAQMLTTQSGSRIEAVGREGAFTRFRSAQPVSEILLRDGRTPLPPYIQREDVAEDAARYQTVFARHDGAVAAPTAGLHFDDEMLAGLRACGIDSAFVTLHVAAGTFKSLPEGELDDATLHAEYCRLDAGTCAKIAGARNAGGRIVAVGTTVVRTLESAFVDGQLKPFEGTTRLFIRPGYRFNAADLLVTNFHVPESSLLMLVCAFGGRARMLAAYRHAVRSRYRFFSYGDAMLISRAQGP